jgi:hypothetical protein
MIVRRSRLRILPAILFVMLATALPAFARDSAKSLGMRFTEGSYARVPFQVRGQHIWVRGVIGSSDSLWFVVDSGAAASQLDDSLARRFGLKVTGEHEAHGAGGVQLGGTVADVDLGIAGLSIHRHRLATLDLGELSARSGRSMDLILGRELFEACVVRFDYASGIMELWDAAHPPGGTPGVMLPLTFESNLSYVEGTLRLAGRAPLTGRFVIDTGSAGGVSLPPEVVERDSLLQCFPRTMEAVALGVGGDVRLRVGRGESFSLGDLRFDGPLVALRPQGPGRITALGTVGNLGGQLLSRCRVTFDYSRSRVWFEPGPEFSKPFPADMSGASIAHDATGWNVRVVNPDTPASEAGLQPGDVVTSVDGEPAESIDPPVLRKLMQTEGRTVQLGIRRGERDETVTLVLRRLI